MIINPLLVEAVVMSQESSFGFVLKHTSKTTDMTKEIYDLVNLLIEPYRQSRGRFAYVKIFEDQRVYVHLSGGISHPDDAKPMTDAKNSLIAKLKELHVLVPTE